MYAFYLLIACTGLIKKVNEITDHIFIISVYVNKFYINKISLIQIQIV